MAGETGNPGKYFGRSTGKGSAAEAAYNRKVKNGQAEEEQRPQRTLKGHFQDVDLTTVAGVKNHIQELMEVSREKLLEGDKKAGEITKGFTGIVSMAKVLIELLGADREKEMEELRDGLQKISKKSQLTAEDNQKLKARCLQLESMYEKEKKMRMELEDRYVRTEFS